MMQIRPISDLRNNFPEIENVVNGGQPVCLTKNGYETMVVMSIEQYSALTERNDYIEGILDEADRSALENPKRLTHDEVFSDLKRRINSGEI